MTRQLIRVERCCCGYANCSYYVLTGIGTLVQGSGFTKEEAERIAALLNAEKPRRWAKGERALLKGWTVEVDSQIDNVAMVWYCHPINGRQINMGKTPALVLVSDLQDVW